MVSAIVPSFHLIGTDPSSEVSVAWNTYAPLNHTCVSYGTTENDLSNVRCSSSASTTYATSRTWSNVVTLTGLAPATTYYYKIVSTNSSVGHFFSPRTPGDPTPFNVSVVIDLGVQGANGYTVNKRDTPGRRSLSEPHHHSTLGGNGQQL